MYSVLFVFILQALFSEIGRGGQILSPAFSNQPEDALFKASRRQGSDRE